MSKLSKPVETAGEALLEMLHLRGIEMLFGGAPTSVIEAMAKKAIAGEATLRGIVTPHEQAAVTMAHGHYAATGRMQAAYLYSTVGTANALGAIINASRARIPMIILAARSPISEEPDVPGARDIHVQWAQDSFDQGGIVREYVKWDHELRHGERIETVVDRAIEMALTEPCGPVYLALPRDVLAAPVPSLEADTHLRRGVPRRIVANPIALDEAAAILAEAKNPVIVTSELGRHAAGRETLAEFCTATGIGVIEASPVYTNLPPDHPCHMGYVFASQVHPELAAADAIMCIESDVPWFPSRMPLADDTRVIQMGVEPGYRDYPTRSFRSDVTIQADPALALADLGARVAARLEPALVAERLRTRQTYGDHARAALAETLDHDPDTQRLDAPWAVQAISEFVDDDTVVVNEYPLDPRFCPPREGRYFAASHAGGLGWGFGAALGIKAGRPDKTVLCALGDGAYFFAAPTSCHQIAASEGLPLVVVVFSNNRWNEVQKSTLSVHPSGWAERMNRMPMVGLGRPTDFERIVEAFGGLGERVETRDQLAPALQRAFEAVRKDGRQALVNIICAE